MEGDFPALMVTDDEISRHDWHRALCLVRAPQGPRFQVLQQIAGLIHDTIETPNCSGFTGKVKSGAVELGSGAEEMIPH